MKLRYIHYIYALLLLCGCHRDDPTPEPIPEPVETTVIAYIMAENSLDRYANLDITEMLNGRSYIPLDGRMVIYHDGAQASTLPCIKEVSSMSGLSVVETLTERNSCDSTVFLNNLRTIIRRYPARHYRLVMWSHGSGWIPQRNKTIGIDNNKNSNHENKGSEMNISAMRWALERLGVHWDFILFDACFMQCVETAYELRNVCDYIVASPAEIPANGAPYDRIMPALFETAAEVGATNVANIYHKAYDGSTTGMMISVADCSKMELLATATAEMLSPYTCENKEFEGKGIQFYCPYTQETVWKPEYYDIASAMHSIAKNEEEYAQWWHTMCQAIPVRLSSEKWATEYNFDARLTDPLHYGGMSIFLPNSKYEPKNYNSEWRSTSWYQHLKQIHETK